MPFSNALAPSYTQTATSSIWIQIADSMFLNDNSSVKRASDRENKLEVFTL